MKKVFDLDIGKNYVRYFSPHSRACYYDTDTNQLVFLNAREFNTSFPRVFYSEIIFNYDNRLVVSIPKSERKYIKPCDGCPYFDLFVQKECFNCIFLPLEYRDENYQVIYSS